MHHTVHQLYVHAVMKTSIPHSVPHRWFDATALMLKLAVLAGCARNQLLALPQDVAWPREGAIPLLVFDWVSVMSSNESKSLSSACDHSTASLCSRCRSDTRMSPYQPHRCACHRSIRISLPCDVGSGNTVMNYKLTE